MGYEYGYGYASSRKKIYVIGWVYQSMKILKLESLFLFFSSLHFFSFILFHSFSCSVVMGLDGERERDKYEHEHEHK